MRVGIGYDVHPLVEGTPLVLGGVTIPFSRGLRGHSDADVLTHAVIDALLGAAALGTIGDRFPDTDPRWEGASSLVMLDEVFAGVDDEELSFCYRNATALIASSIAEGFDLPAVEALHHSLPVLASRTPVHEEIVGATVAYFERAEDLAAQIEHGPPPAGGEFKWLGWEESVRGMVESLLQQPVYELDTGL